MKLLYIFMLMVIATACNERQPINTKNCKISYHKNEAIINIDTVITFDPASYAENMTVINYYFLEDEIEKIICKDTVKMNATSVFVNEIGKIVGEDRNYLVKENEYVVLSPGYKDSKMATDCNDQLNNLYLGYEDRKNTKWTFSKSEGDYWNKEFLVAVNKDDYCWVRRNGTKALIAIKSTNEQGERKKLLFSDGAFTSVAIEYWPNDDGKLRNGHPLLTGKVTIISGPNQDTCEYNNVYGVHGWKIKK